MNTTWDEVHETFIKELDYSRIIFKLNEATKETTDETYAELSLDMNEFLESALVCPSKHGSILNLTVESCRTSPRSSV